MGTSFELYAAPSYLDPRPAIVIDRDGTRHVFTTIAAYEAYADMLRAARDAATALRLAGMADADELDGALA